MPPNTWFQEACLFIHRSFELNRLTGTVPAQTSALVQLTDLYAPKWLIHWVLVICFIECWSCAPLSQPFKKKFLQWPLRPAEARRQPDGHNSTTNINIDQAESAVCPKDGTFIEYWSYALLSVGLAHLFLSVSRGCDLFFCSGAYTQIGWLAQFQVKYLC